MPKLDSSSLLPVYATLDVHPLDGTGLRLRDRDGREFLDFYAGHAVAALGYGDAGLATALADAARGLVFASNLFPLEARERVAHRLAAEAPIEAPRVLFVNSGAEAVENALRVAFRHRARPALAVLEGGFHGRSAAASAATSGSERWYAFPRRPFDLRVLPWDDPGALAGALDEDVAALLVEPVQGIAGGRALSAAWIEAARARCAETGTLVIADEVQCGAGRCGTYFASEGIGLEPDIIAVAKGIASGFPAGAVLVSGEVAESLSPGDLGTTFGGAPLALAAMEYTLERVLAPGFLAGVAARGRSLDALAGCGPVRAVQGRGLLRGLRCTRPGREVAAELRSAGILVGSSADPRVIRLTPPLVVDEEAILTLRQALEELPA